jgi:hypothetical protein
LFWHREQKKEALVMNTKKKPNVSVKPRQNKAADIESLDLLAFQLVSMLRIPPGISARHRAAMVKGAVALYRNLAPQDAWQCLVASLAVGLQNGAMTSLQIAASTDLPQPRTMEMNNATRAAGKVVQLLEVLEKHRARGRQRVITPGLSVRERHPLEAIYEQVDPMRRRLSGTKPVPVEERSPAEILAGLPEPEYRAFFAPVLRHKAKTQAG